MPMTTARERLFPQRNAKGEAVVGVILIQADRHRYRIDAVVQQVTEVLRERHGIQFQGEDDFSVATQPTC